MKAFGNAFELPVCKGLRMKFNVSKAKKLALLCVAAGVMSGCAPMVSGAMNATMSEEAAVAKTATYFGAEPKEIVITQFEKGPLSTSWSARYKGTFYNCSIYYGSVSCTKPGG